MFAQSVNEDVGAPLFKVLGTPIQLGALVLVAIILLVAFLAIFMTIMYFGRKKFLSKADRKPKVLRLP